MLIYNYKKEFLGIDESDLEALGLSDLADLRAEAADFADLFVKTPGFIHNFKHVHWIDYITCNDDGVTPKAIINIKGNNYTTIIDIQTIYLVDSPSKKAFIVNLTNIRPLSHTQSERISHDIGERPVLKTATGSTELYTTPGSVIHDENSDSLHEDVSETSYDPYESQNAELNPNIVEDIYETPTPEVDLSLDIPVDIGMEIEETKSQEPEYHEAVEEVKQTDELEVENDGAFADYIFDPHVASEELGLPVDLVEEFIQDFIAQANSFKDELYKSVEDADLDNLKIQSHKLKGVAANLRVEDALEILTIINTSDDCNELKQYLDKLYRIIEKLSNKEHRSTNNTTDIQTEEDEDDFILSLKDDEPKECIEEVIETKTSDLIDELNLAEDIVEETAKVKEIDDSEVPDAIKIAELEDDEFLKSEINVVENKIDDEDLSILDDNIAKIPEKEIQKEVLDIAVLYDKELIANDIGLDMESFNELFEDYITESKELTDAMSNSIKNNNLNGCKSAAIKLKGMSDNMRIHKFDDDLDAIIKSTDTSGLNNRINNIVSKLCQISDAGDK